MIGPMNLSCGLLNLTYKGSTSLYIVHLMHQIAFSSLSHLNRYTRNMAVWKEHSQVFQQTQRQVNPEVSLAWYQTV